jgi:redox-sensitive bicupin YhaK (pirin superfamily)
VQHSEFNANKDREVKFLQIWVFPNKRNVAPRYDQITLLKSDRKNKLQQIISPHLDDEGMWMHQNAWFHLIDLEKGLSEDYQMKDKNNGLYVFNLSGTVKAGDWELNDRDGLGIWEIEQLQLEATTDTSLLLIEVPMNI